MVVFFVFVDLRFPFPHACARARPLGCHGRHRVEVGSGGRGGGGGQRACFLGGAVPVFSRRRGARLTSSRCRRLFPFPHACGRARPLGCHGPNRSEVGSGGRSGAGGRRACPLSGVVPVFSRRRGAQLTSSRCHRWFPFPHACGRARPLGCHGPHCSEVGSGGRSGGSGRRTWPFSGAVPIFSRRRGVRLTSSRCRRWFAFMKRLRTRTPSRLPRAIPPACDAT